MNMFIWAGGLLGAGYLIRYLQDYKFWQQYHKTRRRQAEVSVDVARMLNGITPKVPLISISPLVRQYLTEQKMWRETIRSWFMRQEPYMARHSQAGYTKVELAAIQVPTAEMERVT